jgi:hypothetical protein
LKAANVKGVCRYQRVAASGGATDWKAISKAEFDGYVTNGIDVVANFEWYEARPLEGAAAGHADGADALQFWRGIGLAKGASIYFSHDQDAHDNAAIRAYLAAAEESLGGYYHADIYGGINVVDAQVTDPASPARHGWQTIAWSGGRVGVYKMFQDMRQPPIPDTDTNVVRGEPFGSHFQAQSGSAGEGDWFDMATQADLEAAVRKVLNEATPGGQQNWAASYRDHVYKNAHDQLGSVPAGQTSWGQSYVALFNRTGDLFNRLNEINARLETLEQQQGQS